MSVRAHIRIRYDIGTISPVDTNSLLDAAIDNYYWTASPEIKLEDVSLVGSRDSPWSARAIRAAENLIDRRREIVVTTSVVHFNGLYY